MIHSPPPGLPEKPRPPGHPGLGLVRATEAGALAASRWMGLGDRDAADHAAQDALLDVLNILPIKGRIVHGEEGRVGGHSPLDSGVLVGTGKGPEMDVEVNAIDGATLVADGSPGAICAAALAPQGTMCHFGPAGYMEKLVVDRTVAQELGPEVLDAPVPWTLALVARQKGKDICDLVVFIIDRKRHVQLIQDVRRAGARVFLRPGGDVSGALLAADPSSPVDLMLGVGGAAEGLLAACAVKAMGGAMLGRVSTLNEEEKRACLEAGVILDRVMTCNDMVGGKEVYFSATGVTNGIMLDGVHHRGRVVETHSLVLRYETGTRRLINTEHRLK